MGSIPLQLPNSFDDFENSLLGSPSSLFPVWVGALELFCPCCVCSSQKFLSYASLTLEAVFCQRAWLQARSSKHVKGKLGNANLMVILNTGELICHDQITVVSLDLSSFHLDGQQATILLIAGACSS